MDMINTGDYKVKKILGSYKNGNYYVSILSDGSKIRSTNEEDFIPAFAESCDCKITDRCDGACGFCYESCTPAGKHGDILNYKFLDTLHPYTEMAINGNDMTHPDLIPFLNLLKKKKVIANLTVNQIHFEKYQELIRKIVDDGLIYGLGVSLRNPTDGFVNLVKQYDNAVIHTIAGITSKNDFGALYDKGLKILVLGYKGIGRGGLYQDSSSNWKMICKNTEWLYYNLSNMISRFAVVSFDNKAIKQLDVNRIMGEKEWSQFYMGDDAQYTFYIDMVNGTFSKSSLTSDVERFPIMDSIDDMFARVRK